MNSENDQMMEAFEQAWRVAREQTSDPPAWQKFVSQAGTEDLLTYILEMDIEQRAQRGLPGLIQQRYWEHPALTDRLSDDRKIGLIRSELLQRRRSRAAQPEVPSGRTAESIYAVAYPDLAEHPLWQSLPWRHEAFGDESNAASLTTEGKENVSEVQTSAGQLVGRYRLVERLGEGGMGEVWLAEQLEPLKRWVALKLIKRGLGEEQIIARFYAERQSLALMNHPNIAKVLDAGATPDGRPFFVMELVEGVPLNRFCDEQRLSIPQRLQLFVSVCNAVQHAHQKGVIHRDLKPSNVLVCEENGKLTPKVIDFGLAKALRPTTHLTDKTIFTEFGQIVGTLQYMSPEQADLEQKDIDTRTDIYSLGVILYELLTGSTPLNFETLRQRAILDVLENIRESEPPRPSARLSSSTEEAVSGISAQRQIEPGKLKSTLRGELDWIVMRALEKDRTRRYETPSGFAEDLERYLSGEPVQARPPSAGYRLKKYMWRHKGLVASLVSIAALLVGGVIGTSWFAVEANRARAESDRNASAAELARVESDKNAESAKTALELAVRTTKEIVIEKEKAKAAQLDAEVEAAKTLQALEISEATLARSNYVLANTRWVQNRVLDALDLLKRVPPKRRAIEWFYTLEEFQGSDVTLYGHSDGVNCIAFSPDGKRIVSGSIDNTLKLWDATTGEELKTFRGHGWLIESVAFSPDGMRVISGSWDKSVKLWDVESGKELKSLTGHSDLVTSVAFSPDGKWFISGSWDNTIKLWDAESGQELKTFSGHASQVSTVAINPEGTQIVSGSFDCSLKLWNVSSGEAERTIPSAHVGQVTCVAFSPDGEQIISGGNFGAAKLWDVATGEELEPLKLGEEITRGALSVTFSPDGRQFLSGNGDGTITLFEASSRVKLKTFCGHWGSVNNVAFSPDGTRILSSGRGDLTCRLWTVSANDKFKSLGNYRTTVNSVVFSPDGRRVASAGVDQIIRLWDMNSGEEILSLVGHEQAVSCISFSPDGNTIVSASEDQTIKLWDSFSGKALSTLRGHTAAVTCVAFEPSGKIVITGSEDNTIKLWDIASGKEQKTLNGHGMGITSIAVSPDGKRIVSTSEDKNVKQWDMESGQELKPFESMKPLDYPAELIAFSPDGKLIAAGSIQGITIWETDSGRQRKGKLESQGGITSFSFCSDGKRIVSGSYNGTVSFWDTTSGDELKSFSIPGFQIKTIAISLDETQIVVGCFDKRVIAGGFFNIPSRPLESTQRTTYGDDGQPITSIPKVSREPQSPAVLDDQSTLKFLDAAAGEELRFLSDHSQSIACVAISSDGTRYIIGNDDKTLTLWDSESGMELATFIGHQEQIFSLAFCEDNNRIRSQDYGGTEIEWSAQSGEEIQREKVKRYFLSSNRTSNGKLLILAYGKRVLVIDLEIEMSLREQARRKRSARLKPHWHQEQAAAAESCEDWYAATFHRAWAVRGKPDSTEDRSALQSNYTKLKEKNPKLAQQLRHFLPEDLQTEFP